MMTVRITRVGGVRADAMGPVFLPGDTIEVADKQGALWIARGDAVPVPPKASPAAEPATREIDRPGVDRMIRKPGKSK